MMQSLERTHSGAPLTIPPSTPSPYNRHRRHYSVAEDYRDFIDGSPQDGSLETDHCISSRHGHSQQRSKGLRSFRLSVASAASMESQASTSTTSTVRRFWAPSPPGSPSGRSAQTPSTTCPSTFASSVSSSVSTSPTLSNGASSTASTTATIAPQAYISSHVVTYIPPLVDATHSTLSRHQRRSHASTFSLPKLRDAIADLHWIATTTPELLRYSCKQAMTPLLAVLSVSRNPLAMSVDSIADAAEALLQIWLAVIELGTVVAAPVVFLCLPGLLFSAWLGAWLVCIWLSSWPLNSGSDCRTGSVFYPPWTASGIEALGHTDGDSDGDDSMPLSDHWFFVSGMGATSRTLLKTGPRVAGVFGHPVTLVRPHTYGAVADYFLSAVLDRIGGKQSPHSDALYEQLYPLLTMSASARVVVLAHNTGATAVSHVLSRLIVDVSADRLSRLEIYTFGSLASDFVLPRSMGPAASRTLPPHIEHITHMHDPCARFGVLRSVRDDLTARYCGGVFVLGTASAKVTVGRSGARSPGFAAIPQQPSARSRRNYRMSPCTNQQQLQQRNAALYSPLLARTISSSSTDSTMSTSSAKPSYSPSLGSVVGSFFSTHKSSSSQEAILSMEDYLIALFGPEPWSMRPDLVDIDAEFVDMDMDMDGYYCQKRSSLSSDAPFLDAAVRVDRELAEKREMAAMEAARGLASSSTSRSKAASLNRVSSKGAHFRLSWTGLGATAKFGTASAGTSIKSVKTRPSIDRSADVSPNGRLEGLETTRRLCKEYDGRPGRDVSVLAGYFADAVVRHREMFGF